MKIATWNVNSIRVRLQTVLDWMSLEKPDVLCLQEIKVTSELFPAESFEALGYRVKVRFSRVKSKRRIRFVLFAFC